MGQSVLSIKSIAPDQQWSSIHSQKVVHLNSCLVISIKSKTYMITILRIFKTAIVPEWPYFRHN
jgi:hypothetical protein